MNRRAFLHTAGAAGVAAAVLPGAAARAVGGVQKEPRQVVVILGESVRADMLNCYRSTGLRTPNLDRLAAEGMRFERAYNCQPVCAPARSALWTGLYPHSNGVWGNSMPLGETTHTIGQRLHDHGIDTAFIGKWHLDGSDYFGTGRPAPGWDAKSWYDMRDYLNELSPAERVRSRKPATGLEPGGWPAEKCFGRRCTDRAIGFLAEHKNLEFMLCVGFDEPHQPFLCPEEYTASYENFTFPASANESDSLRDKPEAQRIWAESLGAGKAGGELQAPRPIRDKQFFGAHTFIDAEIGRLLAAIEQHAPGALVIYTSDHGVFLESHRLADKGPAMYDEITRVPLLVRWPGHTPAGSVNTHVASHIDLAGTLLEFWAWRRRRRSKAEVCWARCAILP